jgi:hypothetical protein
MDDQSYEIISVAEARRAITNGDIRNDVAFQHDVNRLLATLDDLCDEPATVSPDASDQAATARRGAARSAGRR